MYFFESMNGSIFTLLLTPLAVGNHSAQPILKYSLCGLALTWTKGCFLFNSICYAVVTLMELPLQAAGPVTSVQDCFLLTQPATLHPHFEFPPVESH